MLKAIKIDLEGLKSNKINESYVAQFAADIEYLLWHMHAPTTSSKPSISITGKKSDLKRLSSLLASEKKYMDAYLKHGLGDPRVTNNKWKLENSIFKFERDTGLKWPLR